MEECEGSGAVNGCAIAVDGEGVCAAVAAVVAKGRELQGNGAEAWRNGDVDVIATVDATTAGIGQRLRNVQLLAEGQVPEVSAAEVTVMVATDAFAGAAMVRTVIPASTAKTLKTAARRVRIDMKLRETRGAETATLSRAESDNEPYHRGQTTLPNSHLYIWSKFGSVFGSGPGF